VCDVSSDFIATVTATAIDDAADADDADTEEDWIGLLRCVWIDFFFFFFVLPVFGDR